MLLILGGISIVLVLAMSARMKITDSETAPYITIPQTLVYFVWLFIEIVKANVQVVKAVLKPDMEVSPTLTKIPLSQKQDISKVMFANSITLTPGTVSVLMEEDHILVHALLNEMSAPEDFTEMGERAALAVGEKVWIK
jgi:multicomponent Na+:H+ antiporter subunit E